MDEQRPQVIDRIIFELRKYLPITRVRVMAELRQAYCHRCGESECECPKPGRPKKKVPNGEAASSE